MEKKIDKANEHICILIDELVELKVSSLGTNCPYSSNDKYKPCKKYEHDCDYCKEEWGNDKKDKLLEKYYVK